MLLEDYVGKWWNLFDKDILKNTLITLGNLYNTRSIMPARQNIFRAFHECNYDDCKVVMISMDPYPQKGIANGILFSNDIHNKNISPSLRIIMEASGSTDQTLLSWCNQGILMLNSALSVEEGKPSSHLLLWKPFMTSFIKSLSEWNSGLVYILFGTNAWELKSYINGKLNDILLEKHPAYYARMGVKMPFRVFEETNKLLVNKYNQTIKW